MDPKFQTLFFVAAIVVWLWPLISPRQQISTSTAMLVGWILFAIPFAYNAAVAGW